MNIRPMEIRDIPRVAEIHVSGWRGAYRGIVPDEILFGRMSVQRSMGRFAMHLGNGSEIEHYVYDDGIIKGFIAICPCRDEDVVNTFELGGIYIEPVMQRGGIGREMEKFCEKAALESGYCKICLWVLKENNASRAFYEKMGYAFDGGERQYDHLDGIAAVRYLKSIGGD